MIKQMIETQAPKTQKQAFDNLLDNMYITNVQKRLRELNQPTETDKKRWIWELIQNAKDSIAGTDRKTVNIKIIVDRDTVRFCHDGAPFTAKARLGLLYKYSEDKDNQESTGRFGTGFLTTHCLSKIVSIESNIYINEEQTEVGGFFVTMYRDGITKEELLRGLKDMRDSEKWYKETFPWTSFIYHLKSDSGREAKDLGIRNFKENIAKALLFCTEISSIELVDNEIKTSIKRESSIEIGSGFIRTVFDLEDNGSSIRRSFIHMSHSEPSESITARYKKPRDLRFDIAIEVDDDNNIITHKDSTDFFCSLPIVGIESQFNHPFIFNSPDFEPDSERQSLLLNGIEIDENNIVTEVGINRHLFQKVMPYFEEMVQYLSSKGYKSLFCLANGLKTIKEHSKTDKEWYKKNVLFKYREILEKYPIAYASRGPLTLGNCIIIKEKKEDDNILYGLMSQLFPQSILTISENENWARVIWTEDDDEQKHLKCWSIRECCNHISNSYNQIEDIPMSPTPVTWLNKFLGFVNQKDSSLLSEFCLIPNMNGGLCVKDEKIRQAVGITDIIVALFSKLGVDIGNTLMHKDITSISLESKYQSENYSADINSQVEKIIGDSTIIDKISILSSLFVILPDQGSKTTIEKRKRLLEALRLTQGLALSEISDNCLQDAAWIAADDYLLEKVCSDIETYGSMSELYNKTNLNAAGLNRILVTIADYKGIAIFDKHKIIPNQHGIFKLKEHLCVDNGVLPEFKDDIFKSIDVDYKDILLDTAIEGGKLGIATPKRNEDFIAFLEEQFNKTTQQGDKKVYYYSSDDRKKVAVYVCRLIPLGENKTIREKFLKVITTFLELENSTSIPINYGDDKLWSSASKFLCKLVAKRIEDVQDLDSLQETVHCTYSEMFNQLNFYYTYKNNRSWTFSDDKVFPNQNGQFCSLCSLYKEDGEINELLKNIIYRIDTSLDYRQILIDKNCTVQPELKKSKEDAYKLINDEIKERFDVSSNWELLDFKEAVRLLIEEWGDNYSGEFIEKNFPSIWPIKDKILMNVVWTKEERFRVNKLQQIVKNLTDDQIESLSEAVVKNKELERQVKELQDKITELQQRASSEELETITFASGQIVSLGTDKQTMFEAQVKAQQFLMQEKPRWKFPSDYGCVDEDGKPYYFSTIDGVKDEVGETMNLVVKSYRNPNYPFKVNTNEWEWITGEKNATMWVFNGQDLIMVTADDLIRNQQFISISFSSQNMDKEEHKDRISAFADSLHYFNGLHIDFSKFQMPTNGISIRNFENKIAEKPDSNNTIDDLRD